MAEKTIKLTGVQALAALVIFLLLVGYRISTFDEQTNDQELVDEVTLLLTSNYFPDDVDKLRAAVESGEDERVSDVSGMILSSKLTIEKLSTSYPMFSFTSNKKVVVKADYSVDDKSGNRMKGTEYYLFHYGALTDHWSYQHDTTVVSYYLNFI